MATLTSITPSSKPTGSPSFTMTATGGGFIRKSDPLEDGTGWSYINAIGLQVGDNFYALSGTRTGTSCSATIPSSALTASGTFNVRVVMADGELSNALPFTVTASVPTLASVTPTAVTSPASAQIVCNGTNFTGASSIRVDGDDIATTFISATQIRSAANFDFTGAGALVTITVNTPGVGESQGRTITKNNPVPTLSSFAPNTKVVGDAGFTLVITGTGFNSSSGAYWNGNARSTTLVNATTLHVAISHVDLSSAGTPVIAVINPDPGGGTARNNLAPNVVAFTINNPVPVVSSCDPATSTASSGAVTIRVRGDKFVGGTGKTVIRWNGVDQATTVLSTTECEFVATQSMLAQAGTATIRAFNGGPAGGQSTSSVQFNITGGTPVLNAINPSSVAANTNGWIALQGSGFAVASSVYMEDGVVASTWVSSTRIDVNLPAYRIPVAGTYGFRVVNSGGGSSATRNLTATNPLPVIGSLSASAATVGDAPFVLTITGASFVSGASVGTVNGAPRQTTFVSATQLQIAITAEDLATGGTLAIGVLTASPGGGTSATLPLSVNYPVPVVSSMEPVSVTIDSPDTAVRIAGAGFGTGSVVKLAGSPLATTYASSSSISAVIPAAHLAAIATLALTVENPAPGGGTASCPSLAVVYPVPTITTVAPTNVNAGSGAFTLTINGTGFRSGVSTAYWSGAARATTFVGATQLQMAVNANDITAAGTVAITVTNIGPGGGTSAPASFYVGAVNPVPTVTSMTPSNRNAGDPAPVITITGTNFVPASVARWEGVDRPTTYISATQLSVQLQQADMAVAGTYVIHVFNPQPVGGLSGGSGFLVNTINLAPQITGLSPASAATNGAAFTLTIRGLHFMQTSTVVLTEPDGTTHSPAATVVSSSTMTITVPSGALFLTSGTIVVSVTNPLPGGGTDHFGLTVQAGNAVPAVTNIVPPVVSVGASDTTITVNGNGFYSGSIVQANGVALATTFVNSTQVTATLTAAMSAAVRILTVVVVNGTPGGGTSESVWFAVLAPTNPIPQIEAISPNQTIRGADDFILAITGEKFVPSSEASFNRAAKVTEYVSPYRLNVTIPAPDVEIAPGGLARLRPGGHSEMVSHNARTLRAHASGTREAPALTIGANETQTGWRATETGGWEFVVETKPQLQIGAGGVAGDASSFTYSQSSISRVVQGVYERQRDVPQGVWDFRNYDVDHYAFFTITAFDYFRWMMIGDTLFVSAHFFTATVAGTPEFLQIALPVDNIGGQARGSTFHHGTYRGLGSTNARSCRVQATGGVLQLYTEDMNSDWPDGTDLELWLNLFFDTEAAQDFVTLPLP